MDPQEPREAPAMVSKGQEYRQCSKCGMVCEKKFVFLPYQPPRYSNPKEGANLQEPGQNVEYAAAMRTYLQSMAPQVSRPGLRTVLSL